MIKLGKQKNKAENEYDKANKKIKTIKKILGIGGSTLAGVVMVKKYSKDVIKIAKKVIFKA